MKRFGEPEDLGQQMAFIGSKESSDITGANIQIDRGIIKFPF
ncbi:MAG: hypothetical protein KIS30_01160 [Thermoplasmata archaeon]|nr:hypothetical protein [Candidatus Sysuiplasma acidicola]MBX8637003.1 hypothetical protein [Candidatus Sysuiplasma acidicola]MBX8645357.1 hypothetical protein [Candidatus Sysuiplasma acidicola]